jgi:hypothetical protein
MRLECVNTVFVEHALAQDLDRLCDCTNHPMFYHGNDLHGLLLVLVARSFPVLVA